MILFGWVSSLFDFLTFRVLLWGYQASAGETVAVFLDCRGGNCDSVCLDGVR